MATTNNLAKHVNKHNNFVMEDGVIVPLQYRAVFLLPCRKEQTTLEYLTRESWDEKWGFTRDFDKGCLEIARERGISPSEYKRMITRRKGPKLPAVSTWNPASSGPMPRTTAGEVGWRGAKQSCNLEMFGQLYRSPRFTIEPPESKDIIHYNCIFLG